MGFFAAGIGALVVGEPIGAFILIAGVWAAWSIGWQTAFELRIEGDELYWRAPFRDGRIAVASISRVHRSWLRLDVLVIEVAGGRSIWVWKGKGLVDFLTDWTLDG